ncbi:MAG TPA: hypothetical protein VN114_06540 [Oxalicibacterium sp.]|uniref:hypothetical protein n=1 Tax=Oxalicibacterium sp. TaxID=2766525 RepID=UPI002B609DAC|nr:hypothetical protein [Oxalicibacterium sp.]HWU98153.1 hypothetical protein [Oxalicibacterium sp.]
MKNQGQTGDAKHQQKQCANQTAPFMYPGPFPDGRLLAHKNSPRTKRHIRRPAMPVRRMVETAVTSNGGID